MTTPYSDKTAEMEKRLNDWSENAVPFFLSPAEFEDIRAFIRTLQAKCSSQELLLREAREEIDYECGKYVPHGSDEEQARFNALSWVATRISSFLGEDEQH